MRGRGPRAAAAGQEERRDQDEGSAAEGHAGTAVGRPGDANVAGAPPARYTRRVVRVLGIDPGTRLTGWGVVEASGPRFRACAAGVIRAGDKRPLPERLAKIEAGMVELIATHQPAVVAVEDIFFAKHANAALKLGHARGVVLLVAEKAGLPLHEYPPALVKRTVAGRGAASKEQVAQLVGALLGLQVLPSVDATDALAIAVTHLHAARARGHALGKRRA